MFPVLLTRHAKRYIHAKLGSILKGDIFELLVGNICPLSWVFEDGTRTHHPKNQFHNSTSMRYVDVSVLGDILQLHFSFAYRALRTLARSEGLRSSHIAVAHILLARAHIPSWADHALIQAHYSVGELTPQTSFW